MATIDATDLVMGRMAAVVAKRALLGDKIDIINCEKAVITGDKQKTFADYRAKRERGIPSKGPFISRGADRIVRRAVRGMLPYKRQRGAAAYKRVMCYVGTPKEFESQKKETIESANLSKLSILKFVRIGDLSRYLGGIK